MDRIKLSVRVPLSGDGAAVLALGQRRAWTDEDGPAERWADQMLSDAVNPARDADTVRLAHAGTMVLRFSIREDLTSAAPARNFQYRPWLAGGPPSQSDYLRERFLRSFFVLDLWGTDGLGQEVRLARNVLASYESRETAGLRESVFELSRGRAGHAFHASATALEATEGRPRFVRARFFSADAQNPQIFRFSPQDATPSAQAYTAAMEEFGVAVDADALSWTWKAPAVYSSAGADLTLYHMAVL